MENNTIEIYKHPDIPAELHYAELCRTDAYHFAPSHWHSGIEILFFKDGTAQTLIDGQIIDEKANDIIIINPDTLHSTRAVSDTMRYYCFIIKKDFCKNFGFSTNAQCIQSKINDPRLFSLINEIYDEFSSQRDYYTAIITAKTLEIFTILFRDYSFVSSFENKNIKLEIAKKGLKYIEENFTKQISIDDIAASAGYTKYYFCHCFKEITKSTVCSYLNRIRINYATKLLVEQNMSVGETAAKCGFNDISYFTKTFKKYTSYLPSQIKSGRQKKHC